MTERGGVKIVDGRVYARIRYGANQRFEERLPWATADDREAALERARLIADLCDRLLAAGRRDLVRKTAKEAAAATSAVVLETIGKAVAKMASLRASPSQTLTTFGDVAKMWTSGDLKKKFPDRVRNKASFRLEVGRLNRYVLKYLKDVPLALFEMAHADEVMSNLPPKRIKTSAARRQIAQIIYRVLNLAMVPLGLIKTNPLPRGWLPRIERERHYTCLFPAEEKRFLGSKEVDEALRLFIGVLDREGMRVSELADVDWWQWNFDVGTFTATKTKTGDPRMWALSDDVLRAMRIWRDRYAKTKSRPFIDVVPDESAKLYLAQRLRDGLKTAGVTRHELLESTAYTGKLRAHDMRATFVTVSLAQGKSDTWIRDRTAHKTLSMIDRYRRTARQFEELHLGPLCDLVEGLGWGMARVISIAAGGGGGGEVPESDDGSDARIRTLIRGSKMLPGAPTGGAGAAILDASDASDDPPEPPSPTHHPGVRRLPPDVQHFVADRLAEALPAVLAGRKREALAPLARAAKAIDRGRAPKRTRGAR